MFALHEELRRDVSGWFDFTGFFVLLMELLHPFLSRHHLGEKESEIGINNLWSQNSLLNYFSFKHEKF